MAYADLIASVDLAARAHLGGVPVTYAPAVGLAVEVVGIFDVVDAQADRGNAGLEDIGPSVFLRLAELPTDPMVDDPIIGIGGTAYQVRGRKPDGMGGIRLLLHLADA